jgi:hypothetical protein
MRVLAALFLLTLAGCIWVHRDCQFKRTTELVCAEGDAVIFSTPH